MPGDRPCQLNLGVKRGPPASPVLLLRDGEIRRRSRGLRWELAIAHEYVWVGNDQRIGLRSCRSKRAQRRIELRLQCRGGIEPERHFKVVSRADNVALLLIESSRGSHRGRPR